MKTPDATVLNTASLRSRATSGALWLFIDGTGVQGLSLLVFAVMARYVSSSDVGLISIAFMVTQSLRVLLIDVLSVAVTRKQNPTSMEFTTVFWLTTFVALLATIVVASSAGWLEALFVAPGLTPVMAMMSTNLFLLSLSCTHENWLARHFQFRSLALRGLAGSLMGAVVGIALAMRGFGVIALVAQQMVMSLTSMTLLWVVCPWRPSFAFSTVAAREILRFSRSLLGSSILSILTQNGDTALVAAFFGPSAAGIYSISRRVRIALQMVAWGPINAVVTPIFAELQSDPVRLQRGIIQSLTLISAACAPLFLGLAAIASEAVLLVFGQNWAGAAPVVALLAIGGFAQILITHNDRIFVTQARPSWCLLISLLYVVLAVPAFLLLGGQPAVSVALPFVLPYAVVLPASMYAAARLTGISLRQCLAAMSPGITASIVMLLSVRWIGDHLHVSALAWRLLILCSAGVAIYLGLLSLIGRRSLVTLWDFGLTILSRVRL